MTPETVVKWLATQWNATIVNEGGQCRVGVLQPGKNNAAQRVWYAGATLQDAVQQAKGD